MTIYDKSNPHPVMKELYTCYIQRISGNRYDEEQQLESCALLMIAHPFKKDGSAHSSQEARKTAKLLFDTIYYLTTECGVQQPMMVRILQSVATVQDLLQFQLYDPSQIKAMIR
jgi:hypothetical protein